MTTEYGKDISCTTSLRTGRWSSGVRLVAESAFRRLTTPRGTLVGGPEELNFGFDVTEMIGTSSTKLVLAALPGQIRAELLKDERISEVIATVTASKTAAGADALDIEVNALTGEGPFTLQLLATELTVELVGLSVEE